MYSNSICTVPVEPPILVDHNPELYPVYDRVLNPLSLYVSILAPTPPLLVLKYAESFESDPAAPGVLPLWSNIVVPLLF